MQQRTIAVVGLGYVGLPLALLAERKGYAVLGIDTDKEKIERLRRRDLPFADEALAGALRDAKNVAFSEDFDGVAGAEIIVICVPTPVYEDYRPNLEPVESACSRVAPFLKKGRLVILESTVNPGVCEGVVLPILEAGSGLRAGKEFYLAHCPERINPGDTKWHVENIPRVVGSLEKSGLEKAAAFYEDIVDAPVRRMAQIKEAEAVKVVENSFRDINIAFVNELARSFTRLGIDVVHVIEGAATKPFAFMAHYPGVGVGGHCIPVDPYYLIEYAKENGFDHEFLALARRINNGMPKFAVERLEEGLAEREMRLAGSTIAVLGLAYKPDIGDTRESPSFEIMHELERRGAIVSTYDPYVPERSSTETLEEALSGAHGIILATAHRAFRGISPELLRAHGVSVIVDGRNCLDKGAFAESRVVYKGIGR